MYGGIPTDGCDVEIMGYPFFAESISPNESFRRREMNFNGIVGGTQKVTPGAYVGLDFSMTTHVKIDPDRPDEHNSIFQEMMAKPVEVISPEFGGRFNAIVIIKPEREDLDWLKLTISVKEVPDKNSQIPGEEFTIPKTKKIKVKKTSKSTKPDNKDSKNKTNRNTNNKNKTRKKSKSKK